MMNNRLTLCGFFKWSFLKKDVAESITRTKWKGVDPYKCYTKSVDILLSLLQHRRKHPRDEEDRRKYRGHENNGLDDEHTAKSEKEEIDYQNHGYSNRMMNDYGDDGDVAPRGQPAFGSAV